MEHRAYTHLIAALSLLASFFPQAAVADSISEVGSIYVPETAEQVFSKNPPTLDSVGNILEPNKPEGNLRALSDLTQTYLSPFLGSETGSNLEKFGLNIEKIGFNNQVSSNEELVKAAENYIVDLTRTVDNLLTSDVGQGNGDLQGMSAWAMVGFLNDLKCRAMHELALVQGKAFVPSPSTGIQSVHCEIPRTGDITGWRFNKTPGPSISTGRLVVSDMKLVEQFSYDWTISIGQPGYDVSLRRPKFLYREAIINEPNIDPFYPANPKRTPPYVKHPSLPKHAKDTSVSNADSIWSRGLDLRVFAQGENIVVNSVIETQFDVVSASSPNLSQLDLVQNDSGGAKEYFDIFDNKYFRIQSKKITKLDKNHAYLASSKASCIDVMFATNNSFKVPRTRADFPSTQEGWCLGRCSHPVIANSK